ncbi:MAG: fumarate hydratase [Alphaproteobacteria bacterium CG_4_10_14_0_2_um_filter_63_37]|nr:MAG: fumarate hydratase [Proteobacteria bacterium CG1_02_64_396]PJA25365.1 MAG: fumarate hydratase [Alphaproteobacteria bacterium CG_4_10_14_0_2_um_filter_63_37]
MSRTVNLTTPLTAEKVKDLRAGDQVLLTGTLYTARDAAHKRLVDTLDRGEALPFDPTDSIIYYVGPSPTPPGKVIGSAGPTTSYRMDPYAVRMMEAGVRGMIGKGYRAPEVREAMQKLGAVYMIAVGGAAALNARAIVANETIAYPELGPEAVRKLEVKEMPLIVVNDAFGGDLYATGQSQYRRVGWR